MTSGMTGEQRRRHREVFIKTARFPDVAGGDSWERSPDKCKVLDRPTNPPQARNKCWPSCDANVTALETIMALAAVVERMPLRDPLLTVEDVAARLNVTKDWVWDHSSRKA